MRTKFAILLANAGLTAEIQARKFVATVFAVACIVGPAMAWTWDVGAKRMVVPAGNVDSGTAVVPSAVVVNHGDSTASFQVLFTIGSFYADTQNVTGLASGDTVMVICDTWVALQRGPQTARCSTALAADESTANDRVTRNFTVRVRDVSVDSIMAPKGSIHPGVAVTPQARVTNHGTGAANFQAKIFIGPVVAESAFVFGLASGASTTVSFPSWTPDSLGSFAARCTSALNLDVHPENNVAQDSFTVITALDAGVVKILAPSGIVSLDPIAPKAVVGNFGTQEKPFNVTFSINCNPPYTQTVNLTVPPLSYDTVQFANWTPIDGYFTARCQTFLTGDEYPRDDWKTLDFIAAPFGWSARAKMPSLPSGKAEGAGGWLAYNSGDGLVYAAKGENTSDFYSFNPRTNVWTNLPAIPMGRENALPGDGCRGEADGQDNIYMTKGANTLGFWRYTVSTQTWTQLSDVPAGKENVKGGTDLAYYRLYGYYNTFYLLKGQNREFYRYYADFDGWEPLSDAPTGGLHNWLDGSWLVSDGGDWLYAHKAQTQEMYPYNIWSGWQDPPLVPGIPLDSHYGGGKLPLGTGGCAATLGGAIYALKGNNTTQFWKYMLSDNAWSELDTMPQVGTSGLKKKVHFGGDITSTADFLFAFKGSNTNELWRYFPRPESGLLAREGVQASPSVIPPELALSIAPNPVRLGTSIHYAVPAATNVSLKLYNVTGALAKTVSNGQVKPGRYTVSLSAKGLARGVYILKLQSDAGNLTRKVVIE